ncbi:hypothetical protein GCM10010412_084150 [Nonomuraea recticatena]|uniref:Uncharacterized protein n=1 Tax=Nonomuraea recticatena TaxID=46178 RepID=A0ABP6FJT5_9ACTN
MVGQPGRTGYRRPRGHLNGDAVGGAGTLILTTLRTPAVIQAALGQDEQGQHGYRDHAERHHDHGGQQHAHLQDMATPRAACQGVASMVCQQST